MELKPCPFCGGTDLIHADSGVWCKNFECEGGIDFGHFIGGNEEESKVCQEAVAKAWNRRAYETGIESLRAKLAEAEKDAERYRDLAVLVDAGDWAVSMNDENDTDVYMDDKDHMDKMLDLPHVREEADGWRRAIAKQKEESK